MHQYVINIHIHTHSHISNANITWTYIHTHSQIRCKCHIMCNKLVLIYRVHLIVCSPHWVSDKPETPRAFRKLHIACFSFVTVHFLNLLCFCCNQLAQTIRVWYSGSATNWPKSSHAFAYSTSRAAPTTAVSTGCHIAARTSSDGHGNAVADWRGADE